MEMEADKWDNYKPLSHFLAIFLPLCAKARDAPDIPDESHPKHP